MFILMFTGYQKWLQKAKNYEKFVDYFIVLLTLKRIGTM